MKNIEYVYDIREQITPITDEHILDICPFNPNEMQFEDRHHYNLPIHSMKVGHILYGEDFDTMKYYRIQLVHKYNGVHFFKWLEGPMKGKIEDVSKGCLFFMQEIFPIKIVIPEGVTLKCHCPRTEIVYDYEGEAITKRRERIK